MAGDVHQAVAKLRDGSIDIRRAVPPNQALRLTVASAADNEPTKDWIRISVSALHGKGER